MKAFFVVFSALFLVAYSLESKAQIQTAQPATGHFYCNATNDFNSRLDVDFVSNSATLEEYDAHTGENRTVMANYDGLRSNDAVTVYETWEGGSFQFPASYAQTHWFTLDFADAFHGYWISFDCNQF